jgi:NADH-quinone oxidoreductase subunit E/NADH-quinone oxidoreductase subunit F/NADP-reducing hydrogenase subunit HndA
MDEQEKDLYKKLNLVIEEYKNQKGMLIRILQRGQDIFGHLSINVQSFISEKLNIPISTINSVVSFYSLFSEEPRGKYVVSVCLGTACYVKGAQEILNAIKDELQVKEDQTTMDGIFTLRTKRCIGACGLAPVVTINDEVYGCVSPDDIPGIMHQYKKAHRQSKL